MMVLDHGSPASMLIFATCTNTWKNYCEILNMFLIDLDRLMNVCPFKMIHFVKINPFSFKYKWNALYGKL